MRRRGGVRTRPPERHEVAEPGTRGRLQLRADTDEHGTIEHNGEYLYVGVVRGMHAFAPAAESPLLFLHRDEVVAFRALRLL